MATRLRFPVFIGSFTGEGEKALLQLRKRLPASLGMFLAEYHTKLGSAVIERPPLRAPATSPPGACPQGSECLAIYFTHLDDLTEEERNTVEQLGRKGHVMIRECLERCWG
jgi:hypothetical protein